MTCLNGKHFLCFFCCSLASFSTHQSRTTRRHPPIRGCLLMLSKTSCLFLFFPNRRHFPAQFFNVGWPVFDSSSTFKTGFRVKMNVHFLLYFWICPNRECLSRSSVNTFPDANLWCHRGAETLWKWFIVGVIFISILPAPRIFQNFCWTKISAVCPWPLFCQQKKELFALRIESPSDDTRVSWNGRNTHEGKIERTKGCAILFVWGENRVNEQL